MLTDEAALKFQPQNHISNDSISLMFPLTMCFGLSIFDYHSSIYHLIVPVPAIQHIQLEIETKRDQMYRHVRFSIHSE